VIVASLPQYNSLTTGPYWGPLKLNLTVYRAKSKLEIIETGHILCNHGRRVTQVFMPNSIETRNSAE